MSKEWLAIPQRAAFLESDPKTEIAVESFKISKYPVSVAEFDKFTSDTGYVTLAERDGRKNTYKNNVSLRKLKRAFRDREPSSLPAFMCCFIDIMAYCAWAKVMLPTEIQWLSSIVIEWTNNYKDIDEFNFHRMKIRDTQIVPKDVGIEFTASQINIDDLSEESWNKKKFPYVKNRNKKNGVGIIVRSGPVYIVPSTWPNGFSYAIVRPETYHELLTFRVCRDHNK